MMSWGEGRRYQAECEFEVDDRISEVTRWIDQDQLFVWWGNGTSNIGRHVADIERAPWAR